MAQDLRRGTLGIDESWAEHNERTGFALLVKPGTDVVGEQFRTPGKCP